MKTVDTPIMQLCRQMRLGHLDTVLETREFGYEKLKLAQWELGNKVRNYLSQKGIQSVAADRFKAPGVVVSYTQDADIQNGSKFAAKGMQIAAGVPLACDEPEEFQKTKSFKT